MKKNIFKKIISFSFLALFLFSLIFPINSYAQESIEGYFFGTESLEFQAGGPHEKKADCERYRIVYIKAQVQAGAGVTSVERVTKNCKYKKWTGSLVPPHPTVKEIGFTEEDFVLVDENTDIGGGATVERWWYMYQNKALGSGSESYEIKPSENISFRTEKECKNDLALQRDDIIGKENFILVNDCTTTKPIIPTTTPPKTETDYRLLAPIPGLGEKGIVDTTKGFASYLNMMIKIAIGIAAVLAMIMIVMGGIQYMTTELVSGKESGKKTITNAILGLLLALGAFAILNTLNPDLLNIGLGNLPTATITIGGESTINPTPISTTELQKISGIICPGSGGTAQLPAISRSFKNHVTYNRKKRHTYDASTIYLDCSSYVSQVYSCAGLASPGNTSDDIFNSSNAVTSVTETEVKIGDILGWKKKEAPKNEKSGHVFMSLGGDIIIEVSNPPGEVNKNAHTNSLNYYKDKGRIKYIKRATATAGTTTETITKINLTKYTVNTLQFFMNNYDSKKVYSFAMGTEDGSSVLVSKKTINYDMERKILISTVNDEEYTDISDEKVRVALYGDNEFIKTFIITVNKIN